MLHLFAVGLVKESINKQRAAQLIFGLMDHQQLIECLLASVYSKWNQLVGHRPLEEHEHVLSVSVFVKGWSAVRHAAFSQHSFGLAIIHLHVLVDQ